MGGGILVSILRYPTANDAFVLCGHHGLDSADIVAITHGFLLASKFDARCATRTFQDPILHDNYTGMFNNAGDGTVCSKYAKAPWASERPGKAQQL